MSTSTEQLSDDADKIRFLCRSVDLDVKREDIVTLHRVGRKATGKHRTFKVELRSTDSKFKFLNIRNEITRSQKIKPCFQNSVFVNPDSSYLVQREEFRLRQRLKKLKEENPHRTLHIRSGCLYADDTEVDKVDVCDELFSKQLF